MEMGDLPVDSEEEGTGSGPDSQETPAMKCLEKNRDILDKLCMFERNLIHLLNSIRRKRSDIDTAIQSRSNPARNKYIKTQEYFTKPFELYRYPYFQGGKTIVSPTNEHTLQYQGRSTSISKPWTEKEKLGLRDVIRNIETERLLSLYQPIRHALTVKLKVTKNADSMEELRNQISEFSWANIRKMDLSELVESRTEPYDWKFISKELGGHHNELECQCMWNQYLHPKFNRDQWTEEEDSRLLDIVNHYKSQDWEAIANDLGTGRSGYMCFLHFQVRINNHSTPWKKKDDALLIKLVRDHSNRKGDIINWAKVQYHMPYKTKQQLITRWHHSLNPVLRRGRITDLEHRKIIAGIYKFGNNCMHIQQFFLPNRTSIQISAYIRRLCTNGHIKRGSWTAEEDSLVLKLVALYGAGNWKNISIHFINRTPQQIRFRYNCLKKHLPYLEETDVGMGDFLSDIYGGLQCSGSVRNLTKTTAKTANKPIVRKIDRYIVEYFRVIWKRFAEGKKSGLINDEEQIYINAFNNFFIVLKCKLNIPQTDSAIKPDDFGSNTMVEQCLSYIRDNNLYGSGNFPITTTVTDSENVIDCPDVAVNHIIESNLSHAELLSDATEFHSPIQTSGHSSQNQASISLESDELCPEVSCVNSCSLESLQENGNIAGHKSKDRADAVTPPNITPVETQSMPLFNFSETKVTSQTGTYAGRNSNHYMPPNAQTLVAFRTLLLSRNRLESDAKEEMSALGEVEETEAGRRAKKLWINRMETLFSFPSLMSTHPPPFSAHNYADASSEADPTELQGDDINLMQVETIQESEPKRRPGRPRRKAKKKALVPARQYVRSGKYVRKEASECVTEFRRSFRNKSHEIQVDSESKRVLHNSLMLHNDDSNSQSAAINGEECKERIKKEVIEFGALNSNSIEVSSGMKAGLGRPRKRKHSFCSGE